MKIFDFHTRVCAVSGSNIGPLATPGGRGMRASLKINFQILKLVPAGAGMGCKNGI